MTEKPKWTDLFGIDPDYLEGVPEEPKYTESELRVLTEAALRLGRKEAAEQVAQIHKPFPFGKTCPECHTKWPCATASACLSLAYPGRQAASSPRTDLSVDTDLPQDFQAVRSPQEDA